MTGTNIIQVMGTNILTMWTHTSVVTNLNADRVDGKHASELGWITNEVDPQVGAITNNYVPRWNSATTQLVTGNIYNDPAGNVGIGTTSPGYPLDVNGVIHGNRHIQLTAYPGYGTGEGDFYYDNTGGINTIRFNPSIRVNGNAYIAGNVGIGTAGPAGKLQVSTDSASYSEPSAPFTIKGTTDNNKILAMGFHTTDNVGWIQSVQHGTAVKPLALQPNGGNVGIGIVSPGSKLTVAGDVEIRVDNADSKLLFHDPLDFWYSMGIDRDDGGKFKINHGGSIGDNNHKWGMQLTQVTPRDSVFGYGRLSRKRVGI